MDAEGIDREKKLEKVLSESGIGDMDDVQRVLMQERQHAREGCAR